MVSAQSFAALQVFQLPPHEVALQQFLHSFLGGELAWRDEDALLEETVVFGEAEDWLFERAFLFGREGEGLGVALIGDGFGEFDEKSWLFCGVEGEFAILNMWELLLLFCGEVAVRLAARWGVISFLHIFYYDKQL